ncbi:uncharacterized protein [Triticum aestivum]|uniref:uncharacterized protein n=1 Tax=Triticum aestivum TaxID=4565 RepID=UPI001D01DBC9|nr:uncharacterized protein LOC123150641 [Triticum aestivum]
MVDPAKGRDTASTEQEQPPGQRPTSFSAGENGGAAQAMEGDDVKAPSVDQTEPKPASKNTPGAETIDGEHTDEGNGTKPAQVADEDNSGQADEEGWTRRQRNKNGTPFRAAAEGNREGDG